MVSVPVWPPPMAPKFWLAVAPKGASASVSAPNRSWDTLRHRADFLRLQQQGLKWVTPAFVVYAKPFESTRPQVGFTVTKKLGGAVTRNRIRRRLRAVVDKADLPAWQIVLIAREDAEENDFNKLQRDLQWAVGKLALRMKETNETSDK
jgi:ribonuclease P protein component